MSSGADTNCAAVEKEFIFTPTQDWFSWNIDTWRGLFPMVESTSPRVLEIGSWEGRSAVFLLQELCKDGGDIVCIDHFDLMSTAAGQERHARTIRNLTITGKKFRLMAEFSVPALMTLLGEEMSSSDPGFHWVYVDGSHEADDTFLDGELAWRVARKGAIVIFDDYYWTMEPLDSKHHPKRGIDCFLKLHEGEYEQISGPESYQVILKKTSDLRIGFLLKDMAGRDVTRVLNYGINVVVTTDSQYAAAATVTLRSVVDHTPGRMTIYIVDCGLTEREIKKIQSSIPTRDDVTVLFLSPSKNGFAYKMGPVWAKLDVITVVPVMRVLYLDADVLVRESVKGLWDVDLQGQEIGAVVDVGFPNGHDASTNGPYFNSGVLLMDLTKIRGRVHDLESLAERFNNSRFHDQDALNVHFKGRWHPLNLTWNGQGLGTYANLASPARNSLPLEDMTNPNIVHFTGPVHPRVVDVLNPYSQPYTAKPWGYAGAPGHPYREEWWKVLDQTAWAGMRNSEEYRANCEKEIANAVSTATRDFEDKIGRDPMNRKNSDADAEY